VKRIIAFFTVAAVWLACGAGQLFAADTLTFFSTANTYGAFAPCPT